MRKSKMILLSFDTEEFDVPREHGLTDFDTLTEGIEVSRHGALRILDCLKRHGVRATFFCTTNFATRAPEVMHRITNEGHEVSAHGCDHWTPRPADVVESKRMLEQLTGCKVKGYRQPRMFEVDKGELARQGYLYNASLNPAFIPGRYMHLKAPRTCFIEEGVVQVPASVSPRLRIPLFWLSLHHFPLWLYKALLASTLRRDGYFNTYFHPWEFYPLSEHPEWNIPWVISRRTGSRMENRLSALIEWAKARDYRFATYSELAEAKKQEL